MKSKIKSIIAPTVVFCWCFFSLQSCKEPIIKDTRLLTDDDELNLSKDTLAVKVFSEFEQPLVSSGISNAVVGTLTDQNFGTVQAGFYAQAQLTTNSVYFGTTPVLDSCVVTLAYNGTYGKFTQPITVSVFEVNQSIDASANYKTNDAFSVNVPAIGQVTNFVPNITDSVVALNGTLPPHLRVTLSNTFGNKILLADSSFRSDNTAFLNLIKGIYVTSSSSSGNGLVYFNLSSSLSSITFFYHNEVSDSLYYIMPLSGARINHFDNLYAGSPVYTSVNSPNPNGEEKLYVQASAGVNGKILITGLDSIPANIAINKAELTFTKSPIDTSFAPPLLLDLFRIDDAGQAKTIDDDALGTIGGALYNEVKDGVTYHRYQFNIKNYFQKLLQGIYRNNGFYLKTTFSNSNSERVVLSNSTSDKNYAVTLVITYTKL